ncbi:hypothetical protein DFR88_04730 [Metallosphaera sedula]|uniref:Uncharacterized protein n=1 Tax=Metallosphaera prunae TaxID=47304 RepID=A0A4D8RY45_METPR|nr:hypothetical protein DFR88_04730 [Metallosphaera prunae]
MNLPLLDLYRLTPTITETARYAITNTRKGLTKVICPVSASGEYHRLTILIPFITMGKNTVALKNRKT